MSLLSREDSQNHAINRMMVFIPYETHTKVKKDSPVHSKSAHYQ